MTAKARLLYALLSSSVVTGAGWGLTEGVARLPEGRLREAAERYLLAPGSELLERLEDDKRFRKLAKLGRKRVQKARKEADKAAGALEDRLEELEVERAAERARRVSRWLNIGAWALAGFAVCGVMTLLLGVSTLGSALALGVKVAFFLLFLQAALVFAGVLAFQKLAG